MNKREREQQEQREQKEERELQLYEKMVELRKAGKNLYQITKELALSNHVYTHRILKKYDTLLDSTGKEENIPQLFE